MVKRKVSKVRRKHPSKRRGSPKRRLAGFTKTRGKFALVFKRGRKLSIGKGRFKTKKTLLKAASKFTK